MLIFIIIILYTEFICHSMLEYSENIFANLEAEEMKKLAQEV